MLRGTSVSVVDALYIGAIYGNSDFSNRKLR